MKKQTLTFVLLLSALCLQAQELKVKSFTRLERDLLARTDERLDLNDVPCAVVRVSVQKANSFTFEGNTIGKPVYNPGEAIVWMASGSRNIVVKSDEFGTLRFEFPQKLEKSVVYELSLIAQQVATEQGLLMNHTPVQADVYIDDSLQESAHNGFISTVLPVGQHTYRVVCPHYEEENGTLHIVPERLTALNVALKPTYAFMNVSTNKDKSKIFVNGEMVGEAPYVSDTINAGKYTVRVQRKWHLPQEREVDIAPTETADVYFEMERQHPNWFLMGQYGMGQEDDKLKSFGFMVGVCRKAGFYISARMRGKLEFEAKREMGEIEEYENRTPSDQATRHYLSGTMGLMLRLAKPVYLYLGSGYVLNFTNDIISETDSEGYTRNGEQSIRYRGGVAADVGLIARWRFLAFSVGYTHAFPTLGECKKYSELNIGFGFVFGKWKNK